MNDNETSPLRRPNPERACFVFTNDETRDFKMKFFCLVTFILLIAIAPAFLKAQNSASRKPDLVVATDGTGNVKSVQEAVDRVPANNKKRFVIFIKPGIYQEQVRIPANKPYVSLVGESAETTRLTFNLSNKEAGSTSASYSFYVGGHDFYAENLTFENSFGTGSQAVAVLTEADRLVFKNCRFLGWQDTLYAKNGRQYFENCYIEGHVDFIFGRRRRFSKIALFIPKATAISQRRCVLPKMKNRVLFSLIQN